MCAGELAVQYTWEVHTLDISKCRSIDQSLKLKELKLKLLL